MTFRRLGAATGNDDRFVATGTWRVHAELLGRHRNALLTVGAFKFRFHVLRFGSCDSSG